MKKLFVLLFAAAIFMIAACHNSATPPPAADSTKTPVDTVKFDTLQRADSIIRG